MPRQRIIIITILSLCLGGFVAVMVALGMRIFFVTTPSMATAAPVGSLVVTQPASDYHPGDIITFQRHGRTYTHRIQSITNQYRATSTTRPIRFLLSIAPSLARQFSSTHGLAGCG